MSTLVAIIFLMISGYGDDSGSTTNPVETSTQTKLYACPDKKVIVNSPNPKIPEYYVYNGERFEIHEFDSAYVACFCKVRVTPEFGPY